MKIKVKPLSPDYEEKYMDVLESGLITISDKKDIYSVLFTYKADIKDKLLDIIENNEDAVDMLYEIMYYADENSVATLDVIGGNIIVYTKLDMDVFDSEFVANNFYENNVNDFIQQLDDLKKTENVNLFIYSNSKDIWAVEAEDIDIIKAEITKNVK